ncbi:transcriptional regulator [Haloarcula taiwanensis]|uniref:Transcriptional regulator n=1 Tax=Haloarcula taiwanensis TaxID=1932004 RepID=A0A2H4ZYN8_9EURY|nr:MULTISPECIES: helix-turn-helix domain-containing protein [Haloarcula]AUG47601.1 transcriptional regulator [Haloarcula taiwanensis]RLM33727.1 transcriptional regulator [Haloarcula sp. Atlit-120R]RLM95749.1 transcriptional regulator [Haloarcula sp. Atlit-7R]
MGHSESGPTGATSGTATERTLKVLFEIELSDDCSCPLSEPDADIENAQNQIDDGVCHAEVTVTDETGTARVLHSTNQVGDACLCLAFSEVGCVPRTRRVDGDSLFIETYVSDRSVISELVEQLQSAAERVRLRRLTSRQDDETESEPATVDLSCLTTKQREAAIIAVDEGYYQQPRQTTLDELASTLGISKSALSQRLNAVESKLATAAFDP